VAEPIAQVRDPLLRRSPRVLVTGNQVTLVAEHHPSQWNFGLVFRVRRENRCQRVAVEPYKSAIERAFELAQTGLFLEVKEIKEQLQSEGYLASSITGPTLRGQLKLLIEAGKKSRWKAPPPPSAETGVNACRSKSRRHSARAAAP